MKYTPHTDKEKQEMLAKIGVSTIEELFHSIPNNFRYTKELKLEAGKSEFEILQQMTATAKAVLPVNENSFLGAGSYPDFIPAIVDHFSGLGEFLTAYTPYQAEASQGTLQVIFEFQTLMARLLNMDIANASMYDGATAAVEAGFMMVNAQKKRSKVIAAGALHYEYIQTLKTYFQFNDDYQIEFIPEDEITGKINTVALAKAIDERTAGVIIQVPNLLGILEDVDEISDIVHNAGVLLTTIVEPLSLGTIKAPGDYNADIVVGEGQPLGAYSSYGGPGFGFFATRQQNFKKGEHIRKMPGRIVSRTVDTDDNPAYCLAMQTREQHIRRGKATSNICTNQGLMAFRAVVYLSMFGKEGFNELSERITQLAHLAAETFGKIEGFCLKYDAPFYREFVLKTPIDADYLFRKLAKEHIYPGVPMQWFYPERKNELLISLSSLNSAASINELALKLKGFN